MAESTKKGVNHADFSLKDMGNKRSVRRMSQTGQNTGEMINSSYTIDADVQRRLKVLAAKRGIKMNALFYEAVTDILAKYGE